MKKIIIICILLIFIPNFVYSISGACSWHGGVNCYIGADWDGSVICNDSWTDSSVSYHEHCDSYYSKCPKPLYYCSKPYPRCTQEELESLKGQFGTERRLSTAAESFIQDCQNKINEYNNELQKYNQCLEDYEKQKNEYLKCLEGERKERTDKFFNYLETEKQNRVNIANSICVIFFGENSLYNDITTQCECKEGYKVWNNKCITYDDICIENYGVNSYGDKEFCYCKDGYEWNENKTMCIEKVIVKGYSNFLVPENIITNTIIKNRNNENDSNFIQQEKELITKVDYNLATRLRGRILLQVGEHGEAWYVNPEDKKKYYMANGDKAYSIMRYLSVGITNKDLDRVFNDKSFAKRHSGKIFLQVEAHGEAYYIDIDGNSHYLKDGNVAYNIMRDLGLGITNNDLRKIQVGEIN